MKRSFAALGMIVISLILSISIGVSTDLDLSVRFWDAPLEQWIGLGLVALLLDRARELMRKGLPP